LFDAAEILEPWRRQPTSDLRQILRLILLTRFAYATIEGVARTALHRVRKAGKAATPKNAASLPQAGRA
jgi:hypothetical protein